MSCRLFPDLKFIAINTENEECGLMPAQPSLWLQSLAKFMHFSGLFKCQRLRHTRKDITLFSLVKKPHRPTACRWKYKRAKGRKIKTTCTRLMRTAGFRCPVRKAYTGLIVQDLIPFQSRSHSANLHPVDLSPLFVCFFVCCFLT